MFGGLTFMVSGHMCCGVEDDRLMVRVGPQSYEECLRQRGAKPFDVTGKPLMGMVWVDPELVHTDADMKEWLNRALIFVRSLPAKSSTPKRRKSKKRKIHGA